MQDQLADGLHGCRGTFLGAPWGPFHDVRKVWDEYFGRKSYRAHSMGIASKAPTCRMLALHVSVRLAGVNLISCAPSICMDAAMAPSWRTGLETCEKDLQPDRLTCMLLPPGDGVKQLLWRLQHGELPSETQHHPKVVVVHVGTNGESTRSHACTTSSAGCVGCLISLLPAPGRVCMHSALRTGLHAAASDAQAC